VGGGVTRGQELRRKGAGISVQEAEKERWEMGFPRCGEAREKSRVCTTFPSI